MDTKPELIRLEAVDPAVIPPNNMYIKNEILYQVETPHHNVKKEDPKLYYDASHHHHLQETKHYIPDTVHNFQAVKPMSQYPKYQTPKLRAKSTYSPMKTMIPQTTPPTHAHHNMYMKHESEQLMLTEQQLQQQNAQAHVSAHDHNTVQVITPNANYSQQWNTTASSGSGDVTMAPIMEQTIHTATDPGAASAAGTAGGSQQPDAIFIPETAGNVINTSDNSSDYNAAMNTPTINLIPVMTPNGLVFVAANNSSSGSVISGVPSNNTVDSHHNIPAAAATSGTGGTPVTQQQNLAAAPSRSYNRRKQPAKRVIPSAPPQTAATVPTPHVEIVSQEMATSNAAAATSNLLYAQNGPLLLLNENRGAQSQHHQQQQQHVDYKPINTPVAPLIPEKGTVIEEPPKAIYQSRYSDINENSTRYNSKNGVKSSTASTVQSDAELDLDAAITVFKIYK